LGMLSRRWIKVLIGLVAVVIVSTFMGIGVAHPQAGLSTALGSAKSSLVIYRDTDEISAGDRVVANVEGDLSPVFAVVTSTENGSLAVQFQGSFFSVKSEDIKGKMIVVVPFFGALVGIFGL